MFDKRKVLFFLRIVLPTTLAIIFFVFTIFFMLIPQFEKIIFERKKEMIRELTRTAISVLKEYHNKENSGLLSRAKAQEMAADDIRNMRYGKENKDYFWITDDEPRMIMHPYRTDLNNQDLNNFSDKRGVNPFLLFKNAVRNKGAGYVEYTWQWKDDSQKIVPKLSYVEGFSDWGWTVGTGIYLDDVSHEISKVIRDLVWISSIIGVVLLFLLIFVVLQSLKIEVNRETTLKWFTKIQDDYKNLIQSQKLEKGNTLNKIEGSRKELFYLEHFIVSNRSIKEFVTPIYFSDMKESIKTIGLSMKKNNSDFMVITENEKVVGYITLKSLFERVYTQNYDLNDAVLNVMSAPLITIDENALLYEAIDMFHQMKTDKIFVKTSDGKIVGGLDCHQIIQGIEFNINSLMMRIKNSQNYTEIEHYYSEAKKILRPYFISSQHGASITKIISILNDLITTKAIELSIADLKLPPPVPFAYLALGSEGRKEQTLYTDQDNAIIIDDRKKKVEEEDLLYFFALGKSISTYLNSFGFEFCKANIMASSSNWCKTLTDWNLFVSNWVKISTRDDLFDTSIFLDLRIIYGDFSLADELKSEILNSLSENNIFLLNLANLNKNFISPFNELGILEVKNELVPPNTFDIKELMRPIVNFARIYALKYKILETSTTDRLENLNKKNVFEKNFYDELYYSYNFLMKKRLEHQLELLETNQERNNFIALNDLNQFELNQIKMITTFIKKINLNLEANF